MGYPSIFPIPFKMPVYYRDSSFLVLSGARLLQSDRLYRFYGTRPFRRRVTSSQTFNIRGPLFTHFLNTYFIPFVFFKFWICVIMCRQEILKNIPITVIIMWKIEKARVVTEYFGGVTKELKDATAEFGQQLVRIGNSFVWSLNIAAQQLEMRWVAVQQALTTVRQRAATTIILFVKLKCDFINCCCYQ